jgi:O-antigen biosynthesis protein
MDDCSPEPAVSALAVVNGVRIVRNESNLGFIGNVNAGAKAALGEWLVILNNDTVLRPNALNALLDTFDQHANVGLVGAKLLNADGTVQEAGGIVWKDGSAWNWGRGQNRVDPRFNFVRDADYCSGAALAIRRDLFLEMGGFDTFYAPAYYEDTDLAFRIRARGMRVLYQPAAEVFHLEGVSHGRNETSGIKAYQVTNARKFFDRWQSVLAAHRQNAVEPELEAHRQSVSNILIVEACMITPDQDAGSVRLLNMLKMLKLDGHHVTFVADNLEYKQKYVTLLQQIGVEVLHGAFAGTLRKVLQTRGQSLDAIMFCRHYIASRYIDQVRSFAPHARIIFDTIDLHFVREEREAELRNDASMFRSAAVTRAKELGVMKHADLTLVVSEFEKSLLGEVLPSAQVDVVSLINDEAPAPLRFSGRSGILFIGGFRHPPNVDGITWYITEVLPHVRRALPDVTTTIVGSNMPSSLQALAREGIDIRGFVENTEPLLLNARVSIAPLRFGAGIKGKINEAMKYGIPVVATACAVEGMHLTPETDVLVSDEPAAFAQAIVRAYGDESLWDKLSGGGLQNVRRHFSMEAAFPAVRRVFAKR